MRLSRRGAGRRYTPYADMPRYAIAPDVFYAREARRRLRRLFLPRAPLIPRATKQPRYTRGRREIATFAVCLI